MQIIDTRQADDKYYRLQETTTHPSVELASGICEAALNWFSRSLKYCLVAHCSHEHKDLCFVFAP